MSEHIQTDFQDGIAHIRIHRPDKKNALTLDMYTAMADALEKADADEGIRALFLTGTGNCFTSGNDILDFIQSPPTGEDSPVGRFLAAITQARKPLVAAVNGLAIGVGTTMLLHCDLVYAASEARFQMPFVNLGLCPEAGSSMLLPRMIGHQRASELLLLGDPFSAEQAREMGLVNAVFPAAELEEGALARARQLAAKAPKALQISKALLKGQQAEALEAAMQAEFEHFSALLKGPEAAEALSAFMEKRKPDFSS